ncbi:hypothetical protein [Methanosarcina barkeri]|uniref:hypothetical protein n=1 Tax=Methanosarcina barkeri TaxID=2208 RepID=UPI0012F68994|nr:hypothetical protein [Methanosarcina barkeri]
MSNTGLISKQFAGLFLIGREGSMWLMRENRRDVRRSWRRIGLSEIVNTAFYFKILVS